MGSLPDEDHHPDRAGAHPAGARRARPRGSAVALEHVVEILDTAFVYGGEWKMADVLTDEVCDLLSSWDA